MRAKSYVLGIAGGSASGKTTFVSKLVETLKVMSPTAKTEIVGMDRYFYRGENGGPVFTSPSTGETLPDNNVPESADNARLVADLMTLSSGESRPDIIVVEGLMALHVESVRELCDLRLFVDLEADLRALRRMLRDMSGVRGNPDPKFISTYYRECARVGHEKYVEPSKKFADIAIRGDSDFSRIAPIIASTIIGQLRGNIG